MSEGNPGRAQDRLDSSTEDPARGVVYEFGPDGDVRVKPLITDASVTRNMY